jgi:hypothetical protein
MMVDANIIVAFYSIEYLHSRYFLSPSTLVISLSNFIDTLYADEIPIFSIII